MQYFSAAEPIRRPAPETAMMTREDLESYLIRMDLDVQEVEESMWIVNSAEDGTAVVVNFTPPVVVLRMKVMDLPQPIDDVRLAPLYRRLLELNAMDIVHGSYGIEEQEIVLSDALELENLDFTELRSSYESISLAASSHMPELAGLVEQNAGAPLGQQG
jgi:hypothetical protein